MDINQAGRILWKRRWWLGLPWLAVAAATTVLVGVTPPWYQASAKLLLEQRDRALAAMGSEAAEASQLTSLTRTGSPLETQLEVLKSAPVIGRVIDQLQLQHPSKGRLLEPQEFLGQGKVAVLKATDIIEVAFTDHDPHKAKQVANTWVEVFLAENRNALHQDGQRATEFLRKQLDETRAQLDAAESDLKAYKEGKGAVDIAAESRAYIQDLSGLEVEQRRTEAAYLEAEMRARGLQNKIGLSPRRAMAETVLAQAPSIQRLRQQLLDAQSNPALTRAKLTDQHPEVLQAQAQVKQLRERLEQKAGELLGNQLAGEVSGGELDQIRQGLTKELIKAEVDALSYRTRLQSLREMNSRAHKRLDALPARAFELTKLERKATLLADQYRVLHQRLAEARVSDASVSGNVRVVEMAGLPVEPSSLRRLPRLLLGALAGLLLGLCVAFLREYLDDTLRSVEEARPLLGTSLGVIPWLPDPTDAMLASLVRPQSAEAQAYRNLAFNLSLVGSGTYVFGSALPGEGKTTTVVNLGVTLARAGKKVLLVDADLHCPSLRAGFRLPEGPGLAQVLAGARALDEVLQPGPVAGLDVLGAGPVPANPVALLDSPAFDKFLAEAKARYDVVLFDAPPLLAVPDARILASRLHGLVYVARLGLVSKRACQQVLTLMGASGLPILGSVLSGLQGAPDVYAQTYGKAELRRPQGRWPRARRFFGRSGAPRS